MTKLKPEMEIVYIESHLVDKTKVISINKENGTAKLANGIVLNREILKKGYFKRAGIRSNARAYIYEEGSEGYNIYEAYINRIRLKSLLPTLKKAIETKDLISDQGWLRELRGVIEKFIGQ